MDSDSLCLWVEGQRLAGARPSSSESGQGSADLRPQQLIPGLSLGYEVSLERLRPATSSSSKSSHHLGMFVFVSADFTVRCSRSGLPRAAK